MATTKTEATLEDLYAVECDEGKHELVNGELVYMPPPGLEHNFIATRILKSLLMYEATAKTGYAAMDNLSYVVWLPRGRRTFNPNVSYTQGQPPITPQFVDGAPLFAVEVRSPSDYGPKMDAAYADKRCDYFAAGTVIVWDVDPRTRTIASYRADHPGTPLVFSPSDTANAEPALPGWRVSVDDLFPPQME